MKESYKNGLALPPNVTFAVSWEPDNAVDESAVKNFVATLDRPGWYTHDHSNRYDTRLYMMEIHQPFRPTEILGKTVRMWVCENCQQPLLYEGLHLGHKRKWRDELIAAGVKTAAEAKAAYNNLKNLRIECSTCNQSHDWEEV
jgi:hypothetical protein